MSRIRLRDIYFDRIIKVLILISGTGTVRKEPVLEPVSIENTGTGTLLKPKFKYFKYRNLNRNHDFQIKGFRLISVSFGSNNFFVLFFNSHFS